MTIATNVYPPGGSPSQNRLAAIRQRIRTLNRVSWKGRQRYGATLATGKFITAASYNLDPPAGLSVPVYVPAGAWVSLSANVNFTMASNATVNLNYVYGAIYETSDTGDQFYPTAGAYRQFFYTYRGGDASLGQTERKPAWGWGPLESDPTDTHGLTVGASTVYRPAVGGDKVYRLDFKATYTNGFDGSNFAYLNAGAEFIVEVR